jgi:hypothetical protein
MVTSTRLRLPQTWRIDSMRRVCHLPLFHNLLPSQTFMLGKQRSHISLAPVWFQSFPPLHIHAEARIVARDSALPAESLCVRTESASFKLQGRLRRGGTGSLLLGSAEAVFAEDCGVLRWCIERDAVDGHEAGCGPRGMETRRGVLSLLCIVLRSVSILGNK